MHQPDSHPAPSGLAAASDRLRFEVTYWVPRQYGDTLDAGTVLQALRHYQEVTGDRAAAAAAIAAIEAGGPVLAGHLETIADALEEDGQAVSTDGEPLASDAAEDFTVELASNDRPVRGQAARKPVQRAIQAGENGILAEMPEAGGPAMTSSAAEP